MDDLGHDDLEYLTLGHCPTCCHRGFVNGPQGGMSINIECGNLNCRDRFNVAWVGGEAAFAQRIGNGRQGPPWPSEPLN